MILISNLVNLPLQKISNLYKEKNDNLIGYDDIYYYLYFYKENNRQYGKYSEKFKKIYKDNNYKSQKALFRKKCYKFDLDNNKRLVKITLIHNIINNKSIIKVLFFCILFKIKGTKSQGCCYCYKFKLVNSCSSSIY